jgi:hypothetical protein
MNAAKLAACRGRLQCKRIRMSCAEREKQVDGTGEKHGTEK